MVTSKKIFKTNRKESTIFVLLISDNFSLINSIVKSLEFSTHVMVEIQTNLNLIENLKFNFNVFKIQSKFNYKNLTNNFDLIIDDLNLLKKCNLINLLNISYIIKENNKDYMNALTLNTRYSGSINFKLEKNLIISHVNKNKNKNFNLSIDFISVLNNCNMFDFIEDLRLYGINIWLSIVQDLLKRRQIFLKLINQELICLKEKSITFKGNTIFFDLDETLILLEKPIDVTIDLFKSAKKNKIRTILITRHAKIISETLNKINLNINDFDNVVKVEIDQRKSDIINRFKPIKYDLFIDNEFSERKDVLENSKILVADVNMIPFFKI